MFKILKNELYDSFACATSNCPANCCDEDWNIIIDEEAYQKLCAIEGTDLDSKITSEIPHVIIKKNHKCPFITEEGLCSIHSNYGVDYLSNTCKSYPRFVSGYGDIYTMTLGVSCPEVAKMVLQMNKPLSFIEEYHYEKRSEINKKMPKTKSELMMQKAFKSLDGSMDLFEAFAKIESEEKIDSLYDHIPLDVLMNNLFNWAKKIGEESLLQELHNFSNSLSYETIKNTNKILSNRYPMLTVNIARGYIFEHFMYCEGDNSIGYGEYLERSKLQIIILCCVLAINSFSEQTSEDKLLELIYRTMRLIDHDEHALDYLIANETNA